MAEGPLQPLPKYVLDKLQTVEVASFLGLFPEINRSYLTYDNELFIWNYENPSDQLWFKELTQPIRAVGLVVPKSDVFEEFVKVRPDSNNVLPLFLRSLVIAFVALAPQYLVVVATPSEVVVLALTGADDDPKAPMRLVPTDIMCPTDGVGVLHIVGSSTGRVFLGGDDGCLYELAYTKADTIWGAWSGKHTKCRKINHTAGRFR